MVAGEVMPRVRSCGLGFGGKKSSGSLLEWFTDFEIFTPAVAKNLLNSSVIMFGLLDGLPFTIMDSILC